jgi:hypothetical protein
LTRIAWWGWLVEGGIQAQAADEGDRIGEPPTSVEELQGSVGAVGYGYYLAFWVPAPHQQKKLPGPFGEALVPLAGLCCVALGRSQRRQER